MKFVIEERREEIINAVKTHDTVIIKAEAGTGKTTQVPQFLYDSGMKVVVFREDNNETFGYGD